MEFDAHMNDILIKLVVSLAIGSVIGAEREYRNKSAGLRTMILIAIGSTVFTIISVEFSHPTEIGRIASNIVTGVGFLGAGAIMRDGLSISGLTTASTIWVVASLGMGIGFGEFQLSVAGAVLVMVVLILFNYLERVLDRVRKTMNLRMTFHIASNGIHDVEEELARCRISYERLKESRQEGDVTYHYELKGNSKKISTIIEYLIDEKNKVKSFEY